VASGVSQAEEPLGAPRPACYRARVCSGTIGTQRLKLSTATTPRDHLQGRADHGRSCLQASCAVQGGYIFQTPTGILQILQMLRDGAMKVPKLNSEHYSAISNPATS